MLTQEIPKPGACLVPCNRLRCSLKQSLVVRSPISLHVSFGIVQITTEAVAMNTISCDSKFDSLKVGWPIKILEFFENL